MAQATKKDGRATGMRESVEEIWLAGLGALALTEEEGSKFFRSLVKKGEVVERRSRERMQHTLAKAKDAPGNALSKIERRVDDTVETVMHRLGVPTRREISGLTRRIETLAQSVEKKPRTVRSAAPRVRRAAMTESSATQIS